MEQLGNGVDQGVSPSTPPVPPETPSISRQKLSCDACRVRKVGCDRLNPCARCTRLGSLCTYALGYKARTKRTVKPPTSTTSTTTTAAAGQENLEAKIDHLTDKLGKILVFLEDSRHGRYGSSSLSLNHKFQDGSPWQVSQNEAGDDSTYDEDLQYKGDSSLKAHANFTTDVLESALRGDIANLGPADVQSIIQNVRDNTRIRWPATSAYHSPASSCPKPGSEPRQCYLPPVQLTLNCLRMLKESPVIGPFWIMCFESVGQVTDQLLSLYSLTTAPTAPGLIISYIGLHFLFEACSRTSTENEIQARYLEESISCRENADAVLAQLPFHLPTTVECVLAMTLATEYCISQCWTVKAWTYVSMASRISQALGLHRVACKKAETFGAESRQNSKLFWSMYIMEKNLSLQLGRSSTLCDHDLTLPLQEVRFGYEWGSTLGILSSKWLQQAQFDGRLYEELYSPQALAQPQEERAARAASLLADVQRVEDDESQPHICFLRERRKALGGQIDDLLTRCDRISHLSFRCLIYRSVTVGSTTFSDECISAAREALAQYTETMSLCHAGDAYLSNLCTHWSILAVTSAPFFVVLCNAIWTFQAADLQLLGTFIESLETAEGEQVTSATQLLSSLKPLHDAAARYFELKNSRVVSTAADAGTTFVSFSSIYGDMVPNMGHQELFPMQWQAVALAPVDQTGSTVDGGTYGGSFGHL